MGDNSGLGGLDADQFAGLIGLLQGAKAVELKLTVPAGSHRATLSLAVHDPDAAQGAVLRRAEVDRHIELLRTGDVAARRRQSPARADDLRPPVTRT